MCPLTGRSSLVGTVPAHPAQLRHAFCWSELLGFEDLGVTGDNTGSSANAVSDDGEVVAGYMDDGVQSTPFRWIRAARM